LRQNTQRPAASIRRLAERSGFPLADLTRPEQELLELLVAASAGRKRLRAGPLGSYQLAPAALARTGGYSRRTYERGLRRLGEVGLVLLAYRKARRPSAYRLGWSLEHEENALAVWRAAAAHLSRECRSFVAHLSLIQASTESAKPAPEQPLAAPPSRARVTPEPRNERTPEPPLVPPAPNRNAEGGRRSLRSSRKRTPEAESSTRGASTRQPPEEELHRIAAEAKARGLDERTAANLESAALRGENRGGEPIKHPAAWLREAIERELQRAGERSQTPKPAARATDPSAPPCPNILPDGGGRCPGRLRRVGERLWRCPACHGSLSFGELIAEIGAEAACAARDRQAIAA